MAGQIYRSCEDILPVPEDGNLPGDVMVSILLKLPVKSLLKFKSVRKSWYSLISSTRFFKLHLHRQSLVPNNSFVVLFGDWFNLKFNLDFGVVTHNNHDKINTSDVDILSLENQSLFSSLKEHFYIVDSCNGLVCICAHSCDLILRGVILWNPATKKYRYLEDPQDDCRYKLYMFSIGLWYVEATNDFKLVGWTIRDTDNPATRPYLFVYSLSSDSWEKLEYYDATQYSFAIVDQPTFMSGCMHWLATTCTCDFVCSCADVIVTFDVANGAMSCFGLPDKNRGFDSGKSMSFTLVIKGCLSIVIEPVDGEMERGYDVWVMVEYGVEDSWVKRFNLQGLTQFGIPLRPWNDSEIVFIDAKDIVTFYDVFSKKKYHVEFKSVEVCQVLNYVESLASVEARLTN